MLNNIQHWRPTRPCSLWPATRSQLDMRTRRDQRPVQPWQTLTTPPPLPLPSLDQLGMQLDGSHQPAMLVGSFQHCCLPKHPQLESSRATKAD